MRRFLDKKNMKTPSVRCFILNHKFNQGAIWYILKEINATEGMLLGIHVFRFIDQTILLLPHFHSCGTAKKLTLFDATFQKM